MAAYDALLSLTQTTDFDTNQHICTLFSDDKEKIRSIHEYATSLLWFLKDYPEKAKRLEGKIREVAHKSEDIIEHFMLQPIQLRYRERFEEKLETVMEEIGLIAGEVTEERPAYVSPSPRFEATAGSDAVVGLDGDLLAINERLYGEPSNLQVIPIVGMGGIGKTTLARSVYHHLRIGHFDIRAWVSVSQDFSPNRFWKTLLGKLFQEQMSRYENDDESKITLKVYQTLRYRRYLVILDDVWGTEVWDAVRNIFPDDDNGSRIVLTTRQLDVAAYPGGDSPLHEMRFMNDTQSWELLKQKVFTGSKCPTDLEDIGKEIAQRCAGLPLAVVLVAGVLSPVNQTRASWEEVAKNVNPVVHQEIEEILSLSYNNLPHHLRPCFLLIGGFLEDENIRSSRLIKLWVAEGFLFLKHQNGCTKSLEEKAKEYLEDLVKRNLVIVTSRKSNGKMKSCSLHDMVRDLCIRKAKEEKFLHVVDRYNLPQGMINERRICFSRSGINDIWGPTIRTVLCFQIQNSPSWLASLGRYKLARVLDALGVDLKELPSEVFELYQLRYLALMGSFKIPSAISNLVNLQTLIIHHAFGKLRIRYDKGLSHSLPCRSLPLEIWRLTQLRHLVFYAPHELPYPSDGLSVPLENLQTLWHVSNLVWNEKIPQMVPNVKRLGLAYGNNQAYHLHHLKYLHQLEKLQVVGYHDFSWQLQNRDFPCTIKKLTLMGGGFPWVDMAVIGSLPNLEVLKLLDYACNGETWETADEEFLKLKLLLIDKSDLRHWRTESSHFPTLECLVLHSCGYLIEIPEDIGEISTLELIEVDNCGHSLMESAKQIKKEQETCGNYTLQVRAGHEETQSYYKGMNPPTLKLENQLKSVTGIIGLIAGEMMDVRPTNRPVAISSSSGLAPTGKDAVIGIHDDLKAIKDQLCTQSSKLRVIPIVGKGGIGKTTLVRTVYDDPLIMKHFDIRVWLTVSQDYSSQEILLHIVHSMKLLEEQIPKQKNDKSEVVEEVYENLKRQILGEEIDESKMAEKVSKNLKDRRYLIVMDDVWSTKVWDDVRDIFPDCGNGSRIMLTTRLPDVAAYPDPSSPLHEMRFMDDYQSWDLLKQKVFPNSSFPTELEDIGKEIARRCAGLPLAIVLVAGVLSSVNKTQDSWENLYVNSVAELELEEILSLSYTHLDYHVRLCFLFIGGFPEDANIRASTLIKLWVAEGFLKHQNGYGKSLEEVAEEYLEDLVERNLVIVNSRKSCGKIKSCSLHDMVRDLCIRKAQEQKFLDVIGRRVLSRGLKNEERISSIGYDIDNIWGPAIRTVLCFQLHDFPIWLAFSGGFRLLRQLDDAGDTKKEVPSQVFELYNLRYLALNVSLEIPPAISKLENLQTLIIHPSIRRRKGYWRYENSKHIKLPRNIWDMPQLRHLVFDAPYVLQSAPHDGSYLPNLQTLSLINPIDDFQWGRKILDTVPNVKKLGIVLDVHPPHYNHNLKHLHQLEKLKVIGIGYYPSRWLSLLPRTLKKLTLVEETLSLVWINMYMIGSLPNLQVLKLHYDCRDRKSWRITGDAVGAETWKTTGDAVGAQTWKTTDEEFPQLKYLLIDGSHDLLEWITQSSPLPKLKCLVLRSCKHLREIPQGIREIQSLELIEVDQYCRKSLVESAKKIKEYRESNGNYSLQLRLPPDQLLEELDEVPSGEELDELPSSEELDEVPSGEELDEVPLGEELDEVPSGEELDELPSSEELQYAERTVANEEIIEKAKCFHWILETTKVMRDKAVRCFSR